MAKYIGLHTYRFGSNPVEKKAADLWQQYNDMPNGGDDLLDWLLGNGSKPAHDVSDRDRQVAATLMQWLGSPVGQGFIEELRKRMFNP